MTQPRHQQTTPDRVAEADRLVDEHLAPMDVVRALYPVDCPYCRAFPAVPCAVHRDRR